MRIVARVRTAIRVPSYLPGPARPSGAGWSSGGWPLKLPVPGGWPGGWPPGLAGPAQPAGPQSKRDSRSQNPRAATGARSAHQCSRAFSRTRRMKAEDARKSRHASSEFHVPKRTYRARSGAKVKPSPLPVPPNFEKTSPGTPASSAGPLAIPRRRRGYGWHHNGSRAGLQCLKGVSSSGMIRPSLPACSSPGEYPEGGVHGNSKNAGHAQGMKEG